MNEIAPNTAKKRSKRTKILLIVVAVFVVTGIGLKLWYRYNYPYGFSHACSKGLGLALRIYADDHGGWLPHGKPTPEASLGMFSKDDYVSALWVLGGKNVPKEKVKAALAPEGHFGPDVCGWHYIEGLREDDDPQIAVAWDKVKGLGHNGERQPQTMHEVVLLDGSISVISKATWPQFVAEQRKMLESEIAERPTNAPPIRRSDEITLGANRFPALRQ